MYINKLIIVVISLSLLNIVGCSSPETPELQSTGSYQLHVDKLQVNRRDTIKIYGKNISKLNDNVTILVDTFKVYPIIINDSCIMFKLPLEIIPKAYHLSLQTNKEEFKNFAKIEVMEYDWGDFVVARFKAVIYCEYYNSPKPEGKSSFNFIDSSVAYPTIPFVISNSNVGIQIDRINQGSFREDHHEQRYEIVSSWLDTLHIEIDTVSKKVSNIYLRFARGSVTNSALGNGRSSDNDKSIKLKTGTYKEIQDGIEILIQKDELEQSIEEMNSVIRDSSFPFDKRYILAKPLENSNYVKIVFLRKR